MNVILKMLRVTPSRKACCDSNDMFQNSSGIIENPISQGANPYDELESYISS